jgi:hypothetical protein
VVDVVAAGTVLAVVLGIYWGMTMARKSRVRAAADALRADYIDEGLFRPGRIVGRRFTIRIAAPHRTFRTDLDVRTRNAPGNYLVDAGFFEGWPDWNHVKVPGTRTERAFAWEISLPGYATPDEAQRQALWRWLHRGSTARRVPGNLMAAAGCNRLAIGPEGVSISFTGIVTDEVRLRSAVDLLAMLASDTADKEAP